MGSSRVRRQARLFFCRALQGDRRRWWSNLFPCGRQGAKKASYTAEKSGGSKPRRLRGLRKGKPRSRGGKPRRSVTERQPKIKEPSERSINKVVSQLDFWANREEQYLGRYSQLLSKEVSILNRIPPAIPKGFRNAKPDTLRSFGFDVYSREEESIRRALQSAKRQYEILQSRMKVAHTGVRMQVRTWSFFIEQRFGVTLFDLCPLSALDELEIMRAHLKRAAPEPVRKETLTRRSAVRRSKNSDAAKAQAVKCPHGRTMLTCGSCGKGSKPSRSRFG
jgi:hypothetical protein